MIDVKNLDFSYKTRHALKGLSLKVEAGAIFGLLGPNGSGKTTLFRILSTSLKLQGGSVHIDGLDVRRVTDIRKKIGIVFQSPSLDIKLSIKENLIHQGHLYGLSGGALQARAKEVMQTLGVLDREKERVESLSGGLKRRVELAKGLLHKPKLLLLDEPSTGLDPGARIELWNYLRALNKQEETTMVVTTHLMEEADHCHQIAILNEGKVVATGAPEVLKRGVGKDVLEIVPKDGGGAAEQSALTFAERIEQKFHQKPLTVNGTLQLETENGAEFVATLAEAFPGELQSVTFRKPTLEDVFVHHTGKHFKENE